MSEHTDVVVLGGGYAGVMAANRLTQRDDVTVTLINPRPDIRGTDPVCTNWSGGPTMRSPTITSPRPRRQVGGRHRRRDLIRASAR